MTLGGSDTPTPLRVCLATHSFPPSTGGLEHLVDGVAQGLASRGHHVTVVTQDPRKSSAPRNELRADGVRVRRFPRWFGGKRFGYSPHLTWWLRIHQHEFDIVHAFNYHAPVALALSVMTSRPFFLTPTYHGGGHSRAATIVHIPYGRIARTLLRRTDVVIFCSRSELDAMSHAFPRWRGRGVVVPLASVRHDTTVSEPFASDRPVILSAGRLDTYKRVDVLVEAVGLLSLPARLVVCGAGPQRDALKELISRLGLEDRVQLVGLVSDSDLARWQSTAHVVVSLSRHESFGLSLAEGAAAGGHVVASDIPPHREIVEEFVEGAQLLPVDSTAQDVAAALDRALRIPRGDVAARAVRTWATVAAEYEVSYVDVLTEAAAS